MHWQTVSVREQPELEMALEKHTIFDCHISKLHGEGEDRKPYGALREIGDCLSSGEGGAQRNDGGGGELHVYCC